MHHSTHTESALHSSAITRVTHTCYATARVASLAHNPRRHVDEWMSDDVRLRGTPCRVRGVSACCPCYCVCPFSCAGCCTRSHLTGLCQHAFSKGETSARLAQVVPSCLEGSPCSLCSHL